MIDHVIDNGMKILCCAAVIGPKKTIGLAAAPAEVKRNGIPSSAVECANHAEHI
jgi:hypothetical protein